MKVTIYLLCCLDSSVCLIIPTKQINPFETDKATKNGVLRLCLKSKPQVNFSKTYQQNKPLEDNARTGAELSNVNNYNNYFHENKPNSSKTWECVRDPLTITKNQKTISIPLR